MIGGVRSAWRCARPCKKRRSGPTRWRPSRSIPPAAAWWRWMLQGSRYVQRSSGWTYARATWRQRWRPPAIRHWRSTARAPDRFRRNGWCRRRCGSIGIERALFDRAAHVCEFQDYINYHLTGRMVASICNASVRWHYHSRRGGYQPSLLRRLGLEALLEKWPRDVLPLGEVIGGLTAAAAAHLGLPKGLPVAQGGADAFIAMIGLGVVRPGRLALITGSSHLQLGVSDKPLHGKGIWGTYPDAVIPGLHIVEGGQTSTGSIVNWLKHLLPDSISYDKLNAEAKALPPGAEGLVVLDHFQGNRTPYTDANARGVISGLTLKHGPAHLYRAMIEGVSFGTALIFETMRANGFSPKEVVICGGSTRSDLWMQIHADTAGLPLVLTEVADAPALGSAILAAVGAGCYSNMIEASDAMVRVVRRVEPDRARHAAYQPFYEAYKDTYPAIADIVHRQTRLGR